MNNLIIFIFIFINFIISTLTINLDNNEGRIKRFGGWGGGNYRYGPCGYGGCNEGYGNRGGGGWMNMGPGYGMRPVGWRAWGNGRGFGGERGRGGHSHESHSRESHSHERHGQKKHSHEKYG